VIDARCPGRRSHAGSNSRKILGNNLSADQRTLEPTIQCNDRQVREARQIYQEL
jgi:hypothetical protein